MSADHKAQITELANTISDGDPTGLICMIGKAFGVGVAVVDEEYILAVADEVHGVTLAPEEVERLKGYFKRDSTAFDQWLGHKRITQAYVTSLIIKLRKGDI